MNNDTFGDLIPSDLWDAIADCGLSVYSGGGLDGVIRLGAQYPYSRDSLPPLSHEESEQLLSALRDKLRKLGYSKFKLRMFEYDGVVDPNDFRLRVLVDKD